MVDSKDRFGYPRPAPKPGGGKKKKGKPTKEGWKQMIETIILVIALVLSVWSLVVDRASWKLSLAATLICLALLVNFSGIIK